MRTFTCPNCSAVLVQDVAVSVVDGKLILTERSRCRGRDGGCGRLYERSLDVDEAFARLPQ